MTGSVPYQSSAIRWSRSFATDHEPGGDVGTLEITFQTVTNGIPSNYARDRSRVAVTLPARNGDGRARAGVRSGICPSRPTDPHPAGRRGHHFKPFESSTPDRRRSLICKR